MNRKRFEQSLTKIKVRQLEEGGGAAQSQFPPYHQKNFYGQTINWAGGLHYRSNFNKTRDFIGDWTNIMFRN